MSFTLRHRFVYSLIFASLVVLSHSPASAQTSACFNCVLNETTRCWDCPSTTGAGGTGCDLVYCDYCSVVGSCNGGGGACFSQEVRVATPNGLVSISDLVVGDIVLSADTNGAPIEARVYHTVVAETWTHLVLNEDLEVTESHPFFVDGEWITAGELSVGDFVQGDDPEDRVRIASIQHVDKGIRVYNISVEPNETFFANGYLVHNKAPNLGG